MISKVEGALKHHGSKGLNRANVLELLVHAHGWTRGVELGVWRGDLTEHLLRHCPVLHLVGVDRWECFAPVQKDKTAKDWEYLDEQKMREAEKKARAVSSNHPGRSVLLKTSTVEAAKMAEDQSVDFVFVDAGHDLQSVTEDIRAWLPKIKPGGAMLGHDLDWWSVQQAVTDWFEDKYHVLPDKVWIAWL